VYTLSLYSLIVWLLFGCSIDLLQEYRLFCKFDSYSVFIVKWTDRLYNDNPVSVTKLHYCLNVDGMNECHLALTSMGANFFVLF